MTAADQIAFADARRDALAGLVDYAGLFPPAALDMAAAVAGYRRARVGPHAFMLGRFVCTAARLEELAGHLVPTMAAGEAPWPIVVLVANDRNGAPAAVDVAAARDFATLMGSAAPVAAVDVKLGAAPATVDSLATIPGPATEVFFEVPFGADWREALAAHLDGVAAERARTGRQIGAKIRCGGVTADLFPTVEQVAAYLGHCRDRALPYKATAGLHHPFRHRDPGTGFHHHGFVNLLAAAVLAAGHRLDEAAIGEIVADEDGSHFRLSRRALAWRHLEAGPAEIAAARAGAFTGYGSCDFDDPVGDLVELGVLPVEAVR